MSVPGGNGSGRRTRFDIAMPMNSAGTATRNPAIGPAMPMSNKIRFCGTGSRIRMNAPSVPLIMNGKGRKNGSDASTS
ncbi:MAG: hypothetical protein AUJ01_09375 [Acidobacteria bacterium 13_1_40CM_3_65_5]|nr:MAG: hypothetical protein AUJ01_09375 [Acidobacteria bacterium 13_1_40CM_3_65_5]